jgi:stage V sporulation protein B
MDKTRIAVGVSWNLAALAVLALAGVALNVIIGRWYGPATLGTFNIAFALYILLSQVAVFGLQLSALQAVSKADPEKPEALRQIIRAGFFACLVTSAVVTLIGLTITPLLPRFYPAAPDLPAAWMCCAIGLMPFALNKYLLSVVNGLQHMRAFAVFQALRFLLILLLLFVLAAFGAPGYALTAILAGAEFLLFAGLASYVWRHLPAGSSDLSLMGQLREHLSFGARVLPAGMVAELNTRVDVLMLGLYLGDRAAGIYTIASLIYESALMAVVALRNNINPGLARDIAKGDVGQILRTSRWVGIGLTLVMALGAATAYFGFIVVARQLFPGSEFDGSLQPLFWLMLSLPFAAAPLCYGLVLSQGGKPGWQSIATLLALVFNVAANAVLIPMFGIAGAGMAMGLTGIVTGLLVVILARRVLGIRLFV